MRDHKQTYQHTLYHTTTVDGRISAKEFEGREINHGVIFADRTIIRFVVDTWK